MPRPNRGYRDPERNKLAQQERNRLARCWGLLARLRGEPPAANPFKVGTVYSAHWGSGWSTPDAHCKPRS